MAKKLSFYLFGLITSVIFFSCFAYSAGFLSNTIVPKTVDSGNEGSMFNSFLINTILLLLFGIQHSLMARKTFKKWWIKFIPEPLERSVYVLFASIILWALMLFWQPITNVFWEVHNTYIKVAIYGIFVLSGAICFYSIVILNIFDYIGLRQIHLHFTKGKYSPLEFQKPTIYNFVRHPMVLSVLLFSWATPTMTYGHLLFAMGMTIYGIIGLRFEERDLISLYKKEYESYKNQVRMFLPVTKG